MSINKLNPALQPFLILIEEYNIQYYVFKEECKGRQVDFMSIAAYTQYLIDVMGGVY